MESVKGRIGMVLHAHLPYVISYGTWPHGMEWLNEAAAETYLPILDVCTRLAEGGIKAKLTLGITPVLAEQLSSDEFKESFVEYLNMKIRYARENEKEFKEVGDSKKVELASMWFDYYNGLLKKFVSVWARDIVWSFSQLQSEGFIEIITSCATHGYLPLLKRDESVRAQVCIGVSTYEKHFGVSPKGFWLPECAYRPSYLWKPPVGDYEAYERCGVEEVLNENGILYFFVDQHLIKGGRAIGTYLSRFEGLKLLWERFHKEYKSLEEKAERTVYKPYYAVSYGKEKGAVVFGRDPVTALQVWSGEWGYPGDFRYLEFHKKHFPGGLRYWRVTGSKTDLADKKEYEPDKAREAVKEHAEHFYNLVKNTLLDYYNKHGESGILSALYDAELFGHWWFEGPLWLEEVIKRFSSSKEVELVTYSEFLEEVSSFDVISLPEGSWGEGGFHYIWFNELTSWTWEKIYECEDDFVEILESVKASLQEIDELTFSFLHQLAKELLLLQSSDWQFLISTLTAKDYAEARIVKHYDNFQYLKRALKDRIETGHFKEESINFMKRLQNSTPIFEHINPFEWIQR